MNPRKEKDLKEYKKEVLREAKHILTSENIYKMLNITDAVSKKDLEIHYLDEIIKISSFGMKLAHNSQPDFFPNLIQQVHAAYYIAEVEQEHDIEKLIKIKSKHLTKAPEDPLKEAFDKAKAKVLMATEIEKIRKNSIYDYLDDHSPQTLLETYKKKRAFIESRTANLPQSIKEEAIKTFDKHIRKNFVKAYNSAVNKYNTNLKETKSAEPAMQKIDNTKALDIDEADKATLEALQKKIIEAKVNVGASLRSNVIRKKDGTSVTTSATFKQIYDEISKFLSGKSHYEKTEDLLTAIETKLAARQNEKKAWFYASKRSDVTAAAHKEILNEIKKVLPEKKASTSPVRKIK